MVQAPGLDLIQPAPDTGGRIGLMLGVTFKRVFSLFLLGAALTVQAARLMDHRFSPSTWVTSFCLPDDVDKPVLFKDGSLFYDYVLQGDALTINSKNFHLIVKATLDGTLQENGQVFYSNRVPMVRNSYKRADGVELTLETFRAAPPRGTPADSTNDIVIMTIKNAGTAIANVIPRINWTGALNGRKIYSPNTHTTSATSFTFPVKALSPNEEYQIQYGIVGKNSPDWPTDSTHAQALKAKSIAWWESWPYYGHITVPDKSIQGLYESSLRNIYEARTMDGGLPSFRVGCCGYNGLWVVDGSFILEAVSYNGGALEARAGIEKFMSIQKADGSLYYLADYHKEHGIALWFISRHAVLTGDKVWLQTMWPKMSKLVDFIHSLRVVGGGTMPPGLVDGGILKGADFSNDYWNLSGMKHAVLAARWLGKTADATAWQAEFDDYYKAFEALRLKNMQKDKFGNDYLPMIRGGGGYSPNRGQWSFFHSVFPGNLYPENSAFVKGQMAMMEATEKEGLPVGSGWDSIGVWNYLASFYGHAWLVLGRPDKAADVMYAFANHSSRLNTWIEEQNLQIDGGAGSVGDMPHNWASAEFTRLVRHSLVLEDDNSLNLFSGLPQEWINPGDTIQVKSMATSFGEISMTLVTGNNSCSELTLDAPSRNPPDSIWVYLNSWQGTVEKVMLPANPSVGAKVYQVCKTGVTPVSLKFRKNELRAASLPIHLNTASGFLSIDRKGKHSVELFTLSGKKTWAVQGESPGLYDLNGLVAPGVYFLKVGWEGQSSQWKIAISNAK